MPSYNVTDFQKPEYQRVRKGIEKALNEELKRKEELKRNQKPKRDLKLNDKMWELLIEEDYYLQDALTRPKAIREIAKTIVWGLAMAAALKSDEEQVLDKSEEQVLDDPTELLVDTVQGTEHPSSYQETVSILIALEARKDKAVQQFRSKVLKEGLLKLEEVKPWIARQSYEWRISERTDALNDTPLPNRGEIATDEAKAFAISLQDVQFLRAVHSNLLTVLNLQEINFIGTPHVGIFRGIHPGLSLDQSVPVLNDLLTLGKNLAKRYHWNTPLAIIFVLTGIPPLVETLVASIFLNSPRALSRITLTIDPALGPEEVAERYDAIRRKLTNKRYRPLSDKHLQLAIFAASHPKRRGFEDLMKKWNENIPDEKEYESDTDKKTKKTWKYSHKQFFVRDYNQAIRRVLNPTYSFQS